MRLTLLISVILVTLPGRSTLGAQTPPPRFQGKTDAIRASVTPGEVAENITSAFDPTQTYAVCTLDEELDDHEITHRFDFFEGSHQWGPTEVCTRAVEWLEIQAMKSGLREKDDGIVADIYAQRVSRADNAEAPFETFLEYQAVVQDFAGLLHGTTLDEIVAKVRELDKRDEVRDTRKLEERLAKRHRKYREDYARFFRRLNADEKHWMLRAIIRELDLSDLKKQAVNESEPRKARAAQRILETVYVDAAFYFPRRYLEEGEPSHAVTMLQVADYIRPGVFRNFLYLARAYAQKGDTAKAIESLQKAHEIRPLDPDLLVEDTYLTPIREEPAFKELLQSLNDPRDSASFPLIRD